MPQKCCVTNCWGNFDATKDRPKETVSVFSFPKDPEMLERWKRLIPRENLEVTKPTVVCRKHFVDSFIIRTISATRPDGSVLTMPLKNPKLSTDAIPNPNPNPNPDF
jgi:THAP domain